MGRDETDAVRLYQKATTAITPLTTRGIHRAALRIQAARKRYHLAALRLDHVARSFVGLYEAVLAGGLNLKRNARLASTELIPAARLKVTDKEAIDAECQRVVLGRAAANLPLAKRLLDKAARQFLGGDISGQRRTRGKASKLIWELGTRTQKLPALVRQAAAMPPAECGETAASLAAAVALVDGRRAVYEREKRVLAEGNLRLVWQVAKKFAGPQQPLEDMLGYGNAGLMHAADKFEAGRGWKFSTMAVYWISQACRRALGEEGRTVRVPSHTRETAGLVHWARAELSGEPTYEQIVAHIKATKRKTVSVKQAMQADRAVQPMGSFDHDDGEDGAGQTVADSHAGGDEVSGQSAASAAVRLVLKVLPYRHREIVRLRHGLGDGWTYSFAECGRVFGVTRQRAEQMHAQAMELLRQPGVKGLLEGHL